MNFYYNNIFILRPLRRKNIITYKTDSKKIYLYLFVLFFVYFLFVFCSFEFLKSILFKRVIDWMYEWLKVINVWANHNNSVSMDLNWSCETKFVVFKHFTFSYCTFHSCCSYSSYCSFNCYSCSSYCSYYVRSYGSFIHCSFNYRGHSYYFTSVHPCSIRSVYSFGSAHYYCFQSNVSPFGKSRWRRLYLSIFVLIVGVWNVLWYYEVLKVYIRHNRLIILFPELELHILIFLFFLQQIRYILSIKIRWVLDYHLRIL